MQRFKNISVVVSPDKTVQQTREFCVNLAERYRRLTLWNKLAVWGAAASSIGLVLFALQTDNQRDSIRVDAGRDAATITDSTIILDRIADADRGASTGRSASPVADSSADQTNPDGALMDLSLAQFIDRQESLNGQFLELQEFIDGLRDREVVWHGYVMDVVVGLIRVSVVKESQSARGAVVRFGSTWDAKLFSLRQGDLVEIRGRFRSGGSLWANIEGSSVVVVEPTAR